MGNILESPWKPYYFPFSGKKSLQINLSKGLLFSWSLNLFVLSLGFLLFFDPAIKDISLALHT